MYLTLIYSPLIWAMDLSTRLLSMFISCLHFVESFLMASVFPANGYSQRKFILVFLIVFFFIYIYRLGYERGIRYAYAVLFGGKSSYDILHLFLDLDVIS